MPHILSNIILTQIGNMRMLIIFIFEWVDIFVQPESCSMTGSKAYRRGVYLYCSHPKRQGRRQIQRRSARSWSAAFIRGTRISFIFISIIEFYNNFVFESSIFLNSNSRIECLFSSVTHKEITRTNVPSTNCVTEITRYFGKYRYGNYIGNAPHRKGTNET